MEALLIVALLWFGPGWLIAAVVIYAVWADHIPTEPVAPPKTAPPPLQPWC